MSQEDDNATTSVSATNPMKTD